MPPLTELVNQYGYFAVLAGSLLEGETILLLAGMAAHHGVLSFVPVVMLAFVGGTIGDQVLFQVGRRYGSRVMTRFPSIAHRAQPVLRLIERHQGKLIVGVRFMYGLRLVGPFVIGTTDVAFARFAALNLLGAAIWAPLIVGIGYAFGHTVSWLITDIGDYEIVALAAVAVVAAAAFLLHRRRPATR